MPAGRPKTTPEQRLPKDWQKRARELASDGASEMEIRVELGNVSDDLWERWIGEEPEFSRTIKECRRLAQTSWERLGRNMATGLTEGNATVWIFNMKNRFKWHDRQEITGADGGPLQTHNSTVVSFDKAVLEDIISKL